MPEQNFFTKRELGILSRKANGVPSKEIARELGIEHQTVKNRIQGMKEKYEDMTGEWPATTSLVVWAERKGLLDK